MGEFADFNAAQFKMNDSQDESKDGNELNQSRDGKFNNSKI